MAFELPSTDVEKISILGRNSIHLGFHLLPYIAHTVIQTLPSSTYALVTDDHLASLALQDYTSTFTNAIQSIRPSSRFISFTIPPGESSKSREGKASIEDWLISQGATRDTVMLALGGGVVGDLVGFTAATFMRGLRLVQIPTTLLSMVDSAIGGKTAIDTPQGKNLLGAFHQPEYVFIDASHLNSLPEREFANGMAEIIKTAAIWSADDFAQLESGASTIRAGVEAARESQIPFLGRSLENRTDSQKLLLFAIASSIRIKSHIVTIDEKETGLRNLVNFGHSVGHAIEAVLTPQMLHGECVAIGMILEAEIARSLGLLRNAAVGRLTRCLQAHGLPVTLRDPRVSSLPQAEHLTVTRLMDIMRIDKKNSGPTKKIVLLDRIGHTVEEKASSVEDNIIKRVLSETLVVSPFDQKNPTANNSSHHFTLATPGSKSISNRALLLAYLAQGDCRISNLLHSDDTAVMIKALQTLGDTTFEWENDGEVLIVRGSAGKLTAPGNGEAIYLGNAGTASRFLTTVCALAQPNGNINKTTITGNARMKERPVGPLVTALNANGTDISYVESQGSLPLDIGATGFPGGHIQLSASISSQYVSSILMAAPYAQSPVVLELVGDHVVSQAYIDITISMMSSFGVNVERVKDQDGNLTNTYRIPKAVYTAPKEYHIESDASSATYPLALAAVTGTTCTVKNIGSKSLQGDARFATDVLQPMGCTVVQTPTDTTVTGPPQGQLKALGEIDMEPMTDAFLTAAVVAAIAVNPPENGKSSSSSPITSIHGISNQRVKECNRIEAMMTQLSKFGVKTVELEDGLEIHGKHPDTLKSGSSVFCYDDHRVAMSFAVLCSASGGPGGVIEEKHCVEKTWPSFWDDIRIKFGIQAEAYQVNESNSSSTTSSNAVNGKMNSHHQHHHQVDLANPVDDRTIFVIGMRGAGKTFCSKVGAAALVRPVLDADDYFSSYGDDEIPPMPVRQFVIKHGWAKFRIREAAVLEHIMEKFPTGYIVSLGGGIVETTKCRELLRAYVQSGGNVINVIRDIECIVNYLEKDIGRPSLGQESLYEVYQRRAPYFRECSTYELFSSVPSDSGSGENDDAILNGDSVDHIARFFRFITGHDTNHVQIPTSNPKLGSTQSFFLTLTYPDVRESRKVLHQLIAGADALEIRVDLLVDQENASTQTSSNHIPSVNYVREQIAWLKRRTDLPIIFTVRTKSQNGKFPDDANKEYFDLVHLAFRMGCEYVDIETTRPMDMVRQAVSRKNKTKIIASYHDVNCKASWKSAAARGVYESASRFGEIVKIIGRSSGGDRSCQIQEFRDWAFARKPMPLIALDMGFDGRLSRILNPILTPVTHPLLAIPGDAGQLSVAQIHQGLNLGGFMPGKHFHLFGNPIAHSKSPAIHNTGFKALGLPHTYGLHETDSVDDSIAKLIRSPGFGGSSVTIPYKLDIINLLDGTTADAQLIGAVNTVVPTNTADGQKLIGDNTDWRAIRDVVHRNLKGIDTDSTSLVLGAGGTCRAAVFALHSLGFKSIYLFNRSLPNAQKIVEAFPAEYNIIPITSLGSESFKSPPVAIVSTVPAEGTTTTEEASSNPDAGVIIPSTIFESPTGGVAIDMAYKPKMTPFLRVAESISNAKWATVPGITMLIEQGLHQFKIWNERVPPYHIVEQEVMRQYDLEQK